MTDRDVVPDHDSSSAPLAEVAVVDDSKALYFAWKVRLRGEATVHWYPHPQAFWDAVASEATLLDRLCAVIIDHQFPGSQDDGISFASSLIEHAPRLRRVLSSCGYFSPNELSRFHLVIGKSPVSLKALLADPPQ